MRGFPRPLVSALLALAVLSATGAGASSPILGIGPQAPADADGRETPEERNAADAQPAVSAESVIERMLAALGGREAIDAIESLAVEAECTGPDGGEFTTRVESLRPDSVYFHQRSGDRTTEIWSTADATWRAAADGGRESLDEGFRYFVRAHEFHLLVLEVEGRFTAHRLGELDAFDGRACRSIEMLDSAGQPASLCVAESGGLPLTLETHPEQAEGPITVRFADWREIGGVRYAGSFVLTEGAERTFEYLYRTIEPNSPEVFARFAATPPRS